MKLNIGRGTDRCMNSFRFVKNKNENSIVMKTTKYTKFLSNALKDKIYEIRGKGDEAILFFTGEKTI